MSEIRYIKVIIEKLVELLQADPMLNDTSKARYGQEVKVSVTANDAENIPIKDMPHIGIDVDYELREWYVEGYDCLTLDLVILRNEENLAILELHELREMVNSILLRDKTLGGLVSSCELVKCDKGWATKSIHSLKLYLQLIYKEDIV